MKQAHKKTNLKCKPQRKNIDWLNFLGGARKPPRVNPEPTLLFGGVIRNYTDERSHLLKNVKTFKETPFHLDQSL